jgi:hypothetical protein
MQYMLQNAVFVQLQAVTVRLPYAATTSTAVYRV